ncbi:MAG: hypothetical protein AABZ55_08105 [Bdellovibrionota bacterium]
MKKNVSILALALSLFLPSLVKAYELSNQFKAYGCDHWRWVSGVNDFQTCHLNNGSDYVCRYITQGVVLDDGHCDGARESAKDLAIKKCSGAGFATCKVIDLGQATVFVLRLSSDGATYSTGCEVHDLVVEGM